jgi:hypothetical protein
MRYSVKEALNNGEGPSDVPDPSSIATDTLSEISTTPFALLTTFDDDIA